MKSNKKVWVKRNPKLLFVLALLGATIVGVSLRRYIKYSYYYLVLDSSRHVNNMALFSADSAYLQVQRQVQLGPRVSNSLAHQQCRNLLKRTALRYGAQVSEQAFTYQSYDDIFINAYNIKASYKPDAKHRILLAAHWDTRPVADKDSTHPNEPLDGANDGASGVAVLLEVARQLNSRNLGIGVDILFFDAEDNGAPVSQQHKDPLNNSWCVGSAYWAKQEQSTSRKYRYGILLDMVGAKDAVFSHETNSTIIAENLQQKIWGIAHQMQYPMFVDPVYTGIMDDHVPIYNTLKLPMVDIVDIRKEKPYFGSYHHTQQDQLRIIDPVMLGQVGSVIMNVLLLENEHTQAPFL